MFNNNNLVYCFTILESIEKINIYTQPFQDEELFYAANDQMNFNAVVSLLIAIGEESKKIDMTIKNHYIFEWNDVSKMRDKISHNYRGINPYMVWEITQNALPRYKTLLIDILPQIEDYNISLKDALTSDFYRHLAYLDT